MKNYCKKALIVGFGSIGKRHADVLTDFGFEINVVTNRSDIPHKRFKKIDEIQEINSYEYVVISSETEKHESDLNSLKNAGFNGLVLIEKPLATYSLDYSQFKAVYVGYNLRFLSSLSELVARIAGQQIYAVHMYCGSDLCTWRSTTREHYSKFKNLGGGVLKDLSHEIDYAFWLFGELELISSLGQKVSSKTVDAEDSWIICAKSNKVDQITISLNYFDHVPTRSIRVITDSETHIVDLISNSIISSGRDSYKGVDQISDTYIMMHEKIIISDIDDRLVKPNTAKLTDDFIALCEEVAGNA